MSLFINNSLVYIEISSAYHMKQVTGIQRVAIEIINHLQCIERELPFKIVPIVYNSKKKMYRVLKKNGFFGSFISQEYIYIEDLQEDSIFIDIDASWNNKLTRETLFPILKRKKIFIITMHYDIIPLMKTKKVRQETSQNFSKHLESSVKFSNLFICISKHAELELKKYVQAKYDISLPTRVITLGSDFQVKRQLFESLRPIKFLFQKKYLLSVGTIEPRKKQKLILEAYDECLKYEESLYIVFVGKKGWDDQGFENTIINHKLWNKQVFWFQDITDYKLNYLYKNAYLNIYLSEYEGYGLPVAESLYNRIPTVVNSSSSLAEIGTEYVDKIDTLNKNSIVKTITSLLLDKEYYKAKKDIISYEYKPILWTDTIIEIVDIISKILAQKGIECKKQ